MQTEPSIGSEILESNEIGQLRRELLDGCTIGQFGQKAATYKGKVIINRVLPLVVNLATAKVLDMASPESFLPCADGVIG